MVLAKVGYSFAKKIRPWFELYLHAQLSPKHILITHHDIHDKYDYYFSLHIGSSKCDVFSTASIDICLHSWFVLSVHLIWKPSRWVGVGMNSCVFIRLFSPFPIHSATGKRINRITLYRYISVGLGTITSELKKKIKKRTIFTAEQEKKLSDHFNCLKDVSSLILYTSYIVCWIQRHYDIYYWWFGFTYLTHIKIREHTYTLPERGQSAQFTCFFFLTRSWIDIWNNNAHC